MFLLLINCSALLSGVLLYKIYQPLSQAQSKHESYQTDPKKGADCIDILYFLSFSLPPLKFGPPPTIPFRDEAKIVVGGRETNEPTSQ